MLRRIAIVLGLAVISASGSAFADEPNGFADLICDPAANIALARFADGYNGIDPQYSILPAQLDHGLSAQPGTGRRTCRLANGWEIKLRNGVGEVRLSGQGAAAPPFFFSLWVNGRKMISKRWWSTYEYANRQVPLAGVIITPEALTFCSQDRGDNSKPSGPVTCTTQPLALSSRPVDAVEYPPPGADFSGPGHLAISVGNATPLCGWLRHKGPNKAGQVDPRVFRIQEEPDLPLSRDAVEWIDTSAYQPHDRPWTHIFNIEGAFGIVGLGGEVLLPQYAGSDFDNDDKPATVLGRQSASGYFDGSFWIVAPDHVSAADILRTIYSDNDEEAALKRAEAKGWFVYSGGRPGLYPNLSPRYVALEPLELGAESYFYAHAWSTREKPEGIVIRPRSGGQFDTVCVFERVPLNY